jgi:hypothetical protein
MFTDYLGRYSNTLLVSLNNRISVRKAASTKVVNRNQGIALAATARSGSGTDITCIDDDQSSVADKFPRRLSGTA